MSSSNETKTNPPHEKGQLDPDKIESEILANERTFLAWVRTNVNRAIKRGEIEADLQMVIAVTVVILVAAAAVITYMAISA